MAPAISRHVAPKTDESVITITRAAALASRRYDSTSTRKKLTDAFVKRTGGLTPYDWQVDVAEALLLGLDCTVTAGTGAGKTMPFVMPLFVEERKVSLILSPLNALEEDQAGRFRALGLTAVAVNGQTYNEALQQEIRLGKYQVIITSPEMCLEHDNFRRLLSSPAFAKQIAAIVVDEAHCISQWGNDFRKAYSQLGSIRAFVPSTVPCLVTSATLPPFVLEDVQRTMQIHPEFSYHVDLGTDRCNISWFVKRMTGAKSDLDSLSFIIPKTSPIQLQQTMVFFDDINLSLDALAWFREHLPPELHEQVAVYHSRRSEQSKEIVLQQFREGKIKILLTTEAAGMGCDMPHIKMVVQFMTPKSLSIWSQRAGRAGRNPDVQAVAVLLVQPSVFQEIKSKKPDKGDEIQYRKAVESGLRRWIETVGCRRDISDEYFGSKLPRKAPTGVCCDNCLRLQELSHPLLEQILNPRLPMDKSTAQQESATPESQSPSTSPFSKLPASRRDEVLQGARAMLETWRFETWKTHYARQPWGVQAFLPDTVLTELATKARLHRIEDLVAAGWSRLHAARHGDELLQKLAEFNQPHLDLLEAQRLEKQETRRMEIERQKEQKEQEKLNRQEARRVEREKRKAEHAT